METTTYPLFAFFADEHGLYLTDGQIADITSAVKKDLVRTQGDAYLTVYFDRKLDCYDAEYDGMDAGDALIVIDDLCRAFGLSREVALSMQ